MNPNPNLGKSVEYKKSEVVPPNSNINENRSEVRKITNATDLNLNNRED